MSGVKYRKIVTLNISVGIVVRVRRGSPHIANRGNDKSLCFYYALLADGRLDLGAKKEELQKLIAERTPPEAV